MNHYAYISGPITNDPNYWEKFYNCATYIITHTKYTPLNPAILNDATLHQQGIVKPKQPDYMRVSYYWMTRFPNTSIVFLPGYQGSKGAMQEARISKELNYLTMYFDPSIPAINGIPNELLL